MKIYVNGCSTTYGHELPESSRLNKVWAKLVANHYRAELFNDAVKGGSNDRIVGRVITQINNFDKFYIQWSFVDRFLLYDANNWNEVNFQKILLNDQYKDKEYFLKFGKLYYTYWCNSLFDFKKWLQQIILLQNFFERHKKPYIMFSAPHNNYQTFCVSREQFISEFSKIVDISNISDDMILDQFDQVQTLLSLINFDTFIAPTKMYVIQLCQEYPLAAGGHPLEQGHAALAQYLIEFEQTKSVT
jgi:hypothetical protein